MFSYESGEYRNHECKGAQAFSFLAKGLAHAVIVIYLAL